MKTAFIGVWRSFSSVAKLVNSFVLCHRSFYNIDMNRTKFSVGLTK